MDGFAYYNGVFGRRDEIKIPLSDRSIFFGDAIYDAAIGTSGKIFLEEEHISRFLDNAKRLNINHSYTYEQISETLKSVVKNSKIPSYFLYFQLSRNSEKRIHSAKKCYSPNLLITVEPIEIDDLSTPLSLITAEDLRYHYCDIKTVNLLPSVIAATKAELLGCDETVFYRGDIVTECSHSNISIIKNGTLFTHPTNNLILPGITRKHLLSACKKLDIPYSETPFTLDELFDADEILVTSTSKLCRTANAIDGRICGGKDPKKSGEICRYLMEEYIEFSKSL